MINFLKETEEAIVKHGYTIEDITFIGSSDGYSCTWDEFALVTNFEYDDSYGTAQIASDLTILFKDGVYLVRAEYDGSEWWEIRKPFVVPVDTMPITSLHARYGGTLHAINKD